MDVPDRLPLDVSGLSIGESVRVADLAVPDGVTLLDDEETVVASVTQPTRVELPEEMLDEEEAAEAAETPPEQKPESAAGEPADPDADAAGEHRPAEG